ncbi:MAG: lycopene cyclase family protein, partial [Rubrobacteraceae bacterium]
GYIPMTDYEFPRRLGERAYSIGMLGGGSRPSTGYTFVRIQRYCRTLAAALVHGEEPPNRTESRRFGVLDAIFLRFMLRHPERCPEVYARMFAGVPPESLVRFLTEKSTPADELRLIQALPKTPFLGISARMLFGDHHATR